MKSRKVIQEQTITEMQERIAAIEKVLNAYLSFTLLPLSVQILAELEFYNVGEIREETLCLAIAKETGAPEEEIVDTYITRFAAEFLTVRYSSLYETKFYSLGAPVVAIVNQIKEVLQRERGI